MGVRPLCGLQQLIDNMLRGRLIGIAHAEIDNVLTAGTGRRLQLINDVKDVRR